MQQVVDHFHSVFNGFRLNKEKKDGDYVVGMVSVLLLAIKTCPLRQDGEHSFY